MPLRVLCIIRLSFLLLPPSSIGIQDIHRIAVTKYLFDFAFPGYWSNLQQLAVLLAPKAAIVVAPLSLAVLPLVAVQFYIKYHRSAPCMAQVTASTL